MGSAGGSGLLTLGLFRRRSKRMNVIEKEFKTHQVSRPLPLAVPFRLVLQLAN